MASFPFPPAHSPPAFEQVPGRLAVNEAWQRWFLAVQAELQEHGTSLEDLEDSVADLEAAGLLIAARLDAQVPIDVPASAMLPSVAGGCAALAQVASGVGCPDITTLDFDAAAEESAEFALQAPPDWDEGPIFYQVYWSHAATAAPYGVVWGLQALAVPSGTAIGTAFGAAAVAVGTGGTTDTLYQTASSGGTTLAGTPTWEDRIFFRVSRQVSTPADTLPIDARLHSVRVFFGVNPVTPP